RSFGVITPSRLQDAPVRFLLARRFPLRSDLLCRDTAASCCIPSALLFRVRLQASDLGSVGRLNVWQKTRTTYSRRLSPRSRPRSTLLPHLRSWNESQTAVMSTWRRGSQRCLLFRRVIVTRRKP